VQNDYRQTQKKLSQVLKYPRMKFIINCRFFYVQCENYGKESFDAKYISKK